MEVSSFGTHTYLITNTDMYMLPNILHPHAVLTLTALQLLISIITAEYFGYMQVFSVNVNEGPGKRASHPSENTTTPLV